MLSMVMLGFAFSEVATSSFHSLCCSGELAGGAQSTLIVTWPLAELLAAVVLPHAAAPSPRAATTVIPAIIRWLVRRCSRLNIDSSFPGLENIDASTYVYEL